MINAHIFCTALTLYCFDYWFYKLLCCLFQCNKPETFRMFNGSGRFNPPKKVHKKYREVSASKNPHFLKKDEVEGRALKRYTHFLIPCNHCTPDWLRSKHDKVSKNSDHVSIFINGSVPYFAMWNLL